MNIENIEAFVYINHYGSFNKASEILFLSQPTVTARIQSLERELGCKVFDRMGKQIHLTEKGRQFLPYAQQILHTYQKSRHHLESRRTTTNELRIGSTISISSYLMPKLLVHLHRQFPHVQFKLTTAPSDKLTGLLENQEIDLAFVRKMMNPAFQSYPFYDDPIRLYVYKGHPLANAGRATIRDIRSEPLVFFECGSLDWLRIQRVFETMEYPPSILFQVDNAETAKKLVLEQAGICFLPDLSVREETREGKLIAVDIAETAGISLQTHLISLAGGNADMVEALLGIGHNLTD